MILYDNSNDYRDEFVSFWNNTVRKIRSRSMILGILMIILGILCLVFPVKFLLVIEIFASIAIILAGIEEIRLYSTTPVYFRSGTVLLSGILNILLGILLIFSPSEVMLTTFAFLMAINLISFAIAQFTTANRLKFYGSNDTGWITGNGVINIIIAIILIFLPQTSAAISLIAGIFLLAGGISLVVHAVKARDLKIR